MLVIHIAKIITFLVTAPYFYIMAVNIIYGNLLIYYPFYGWFMMLVIATLYAENQATSLAIPLIVWAFFLAFERKYWRMLIPLIGIVFFKENMPLVWVSLGFFIALEQKI